LRVRTIALSIAASVLLALAWPASAEAEDPPRFVYGGAEITRWWNETHDPNITLTTGRQAAHYLNGIVVAYLRAVERAQLVERWRGVARCESGDNPSINTGNGYYGWVQFSLPTWRSVGGAGLPSDHGRAEQAHRAEILRSRAGLGQWPRCGIYYG
jgi:hypothetical protein